MADFNELYDLIDDYYTEADNSSGKAIAQQIKQYVTVIKQAKKKFGAAIKQGDKALAKVALKEAKMAVKSAKRLAGGLSAADLNAAAPALIGISTAVGTLVGALTIPTWSAGKKGVGKFKDWRAAKKNAKNPAGDPATLDDEYYAGESAYDRAMGQLYTEGLIDGLKTWNENRKANKANKANKKGGSAPAPAAQSQEPQAVKNKLFDLGKSISDAKEFIKANKVSMGVSTGVGAAVGAGTGVALAKLNVTGKMAYKKIMKSLDDAEKAITEMERQLANWGKPMKESVFDYADYDMYYEFAEDLDSYMNMDYDMYFESDYDDYDDYDDYGYDDDYDDYGNTLEDNIVEAIEESVYTGEIDEDEAEVLYEMMMED